MPDAPRTVAAPAEPCARCGGDSEFEIAALWLCIECYHVAGSTCAGIGRIPPDPSGSAVAPVADGAALLGAPDQVC
jgi:hypothetical protein